MNHAQEKEPTRNGKFYKLMNFTVFAALLKEVSKGCKDTVLPDPPLKNDSV